MGHIFSTLRRRFQAISLIAVLLFALSPLTAQAAFLSNPLDGLSSTRAVATGVTHTVAFTPGTDGDIAQIRLQFATASGGTTVPAHLNLSSVSLGAVTGIAGSWDLNASASSSGLLLLNPDAPQTGSTMTAISFELNNIVNPEIGDCLTSPPTLEDTCWVGITTYSDDGSTPIDTGNASYGITEKPAFVFAVDSVASGATYGGLTSTSASTSTSLPFGLIRIGGVAYVTQKLTVTTNAPGGYTVYAFLDAALPGSEGTDHFSAFGATNATWTTPKAWESPGGTTPNSNTGWIAAHTTDTRVSGWSGASGKVGPISPDPQPVAVSSGPDRLGSTIYLTYALGVNALQASDSYAGHILYRAVSNF